MDPVVIVPQPEPTPAPAEGNGTFERIGERMPQPRLLSVLIVSGALLALGFLGHHPGPKPNPRPILKAGCGIDPNGCR
jgi:hypothetical protein